LDLDLKGKMVLEPSAGKGDIVDFCVCSGLVEKELAYWIYYEDGHTFYCENCIDKRLEEINTNK